MHDVAVVGGGLVGLTTALTLLERAPDLRVVVLEKEDGWARHQSGRNSGVIHSGIYYAPGSLKARLARAGARRLVEFCRAHGVAHELCGKVIVATSDAEVARLETLHARAEANGVAVERLGPEALREVEPHVTGRAALRVPETGIADYRGVAGVCASLIASRGGELRTRAEVRAVRRDPAGLVLETTAGAFAARVLVNCAGLHSDRIARMAGTVPPVRIVPFRGDYYELVPERRHLVRHLVYPVPDPAFPFLGVHFTRMIDGSVHAGPNAVLSLEREGYSRTAWRTADAIETLAYPGFWRLARRHWRAGAAEVARAFSRRRFVRALQRLVPEIRDADVVPAAPGVRAQALAADGRLVDDFLVVRGPRAVHVCNAPSPAATASFAIADLIVEQVATELPLRGAVEVR